MEKGWYRGYIRSYIGTNFLFAQRGIFYMKFLQKCSKLLSDYTALFVIAVAIVTFFAHSLMSWVNFSLFFDFIGNKFTNQSLIIGIIMFTMGLTLTTEDFKILAARPFDICIGACAQYLIMPFLAYTLTKVLNLSPAIALGLILVGCCPGGVSSNIMSYLCGGDVAFSVGMTTVSTLLSPVMTPIMVSLLAHGAKISIHGFPMFVSILETVLLPIAVGFYLNHKFGQHKVFKELQSVMPGIAVIGLACVVGGVVSSQGENFFTSGVVVFVAVFLHNSLGYALGYLAGKLAGMNVKKKRTISIEVGMQNAGLATNLVTTTAQFAALPQAAIICAVSCVWHSISGILIAALYAQMDKRSVSVKNKSTQTEF
jgi:BASS family bile acid:Na+ symporter